HRLHHALDPAVGQLGKYTDDGFQLVSTVARLNDRPCGVKISPELVRPIGHQLFVDIEFKAALLTRWHIQRMFNTINDDGIAFAEQKADLRQPAHGEGGPRQQRVSAVAVIENIVYPGNDRIDRYPPGFVRVELDAPDV